MNKVAVVLMALISTLSVSPAIAQTHTGNLSLSSQAEVNAFNYSEVTGSLTISGVDIVDLSPLSVLTSVGTYLSISDNTTLVVVVDGFENLTNVGLAIYVYNNTDLVSFSGFDRLVQTGDNIDFWYNDSLTAVSGFGSLHTAGWSLEFGGNPLLESIPEFESLEIMTSSLFILDNVSLTSITGFNSLQDVDWSFDIIGNSSLNNLCGFFNYFSVNNPYAGGGSLNISANHPDLPDPTTIQDVLDAGPCQIPPEQLIENLILNIEAMGLPNGTTNTLIRALAKTQKSLHSGRLGTATRQLEALIDDIFSLEQRGRLDGATADECVAAVSEIIDAINS